MHITLLQTDIYWEDIKRNINRADQLIRKAPKSNLYVLPEMWNTGFITEPQKHAEALSSHEALEWMCRTATELNAAIAGSIAVKEDNTYKNRFYFVKPNGEVTYYDKHHLFTYGEEDKYYTAGNERVIVEWKGVRFLLLICYDLRFPIWNRNEANGYDVALYAASWPTARIQAWRTLLLARAIENQCYVCGVNRIGNDTSCEYCGGTIIVNPYGQVLHACPDNTECYITADIDMAVLHSFREKFPVLTDRDI